MGVSGENKPRQEYCPWDDVAVLVKVLVLETLDRIGVLDPRIRPGHFSASRVEPFPGLQHEASQRRLQPHLILTP